MTGASSSDARPVIASNGISITPDYRPADAPAADYIVVCSGGDADRLTAQQPLTGSEEPAARRPYRQRGRRRLLSGAGRAARRSCLHPALAEPAGLRRSLPAHRAGAQTLCHRPHPLHLGRRHRRLRHDARHHRRPSWRGAVAPGGGVVRARPHQRHGRPRKAAVAAAHRHSQRSRSRRRGADGRAHGARRNRSRQIAAGSASRSGSSSGPSTPSSRPAPATISASCAWSAPAIFSTFLPVGARGRPRLRLRELLGVRAGVPQDLSQDAGRLRR